MGTSEETQVTAAVGGWSPGFAGTPVTVTTVWPGGGGPGAGSRGGMTGGESVGSTGIGIQPGIPPNASVGITHLLPTTTVLRRTSVMN